MFISFDNPYYLLLLLVVPFLIFFHFFSLKKIRQSSLRFANFEAIARVRGIDLYSKKISILILNLILVSLLVLSLSGFNFHNEVSASGFSFVVIIDSSESMTARDISPNRIVVAKNTANDFIDTLPYESYAGVVSFSGESYVEQDITKNKQLLKDAINRIEVSSVDGTNVHGAVLAAGNLLEGESNGAIILLSDGQINLGKIPDAISYAEENEIMIHTIGIGTLGGGEAVYGLSKLDEDSLKSLSYNTDGVYFNAEDETEMSEAFSSIIQETEKIGKIELRNYLLMLVLILFLVEIFLVSTNRIV
jgi:Ca-activated chloride channel homolog